MTGTRPRVTRWSVLVLVACAFGATALVRALEQASGAMPPPVTMTREADQARVMKELGITSIPHGPASSSPDTYDESTANPYPTLPDPLVMNDGTRVASAAMWPTRRAEILELFEREVYGRTPTNTPKVTWEVKETTRGTNGDVPILTRQLVGHVDNSSYPAVTVDIEARVSTPANAPGPVPVILQFSGGFFYTGFTGRGGRAGRAGRAGAPAFRGPTGPTWQQQLLARGWGYASINTSSVQADNGGGLTQGIIGLVNRGQPRELDDWGALAAWSWGASRVLDYFETDPAVDATRVGLEGHSRWGKATLLAMALDPRFAIAYVSSSGAGGAKIYRRKYGETVDNVAAANEYHWMAGNFLKYAGHWNDLPVDSNELVALCAPRPVFISGGKGPDTNPDGSIALKPDGTAKAINDAWVDAKGMFLAAAGASPVYELLGRKGLGTTAFPPIETALISGDVGFRQHSGGHTDAPNWPTFLQFASRYLKVK